MLDFPEAASSLWRINSETGVRPEYLLPVLWLESGFDPSIPNRAGEPFFGINQASVPLITQYAGVDPQTYLTWPASRQLDTVVRGYLAGLVHSYGPLRSATRTYQSNFLPGTLNTARKLDDVITASPSAFYTHNAGLDVNHDGVITVADLAANMKRVAATPQVQQAIRDTYAAKDSATGLGSPFSSSPEDIDHIVYGSDFTVSDRYPAASMIAKGILIGGFAFGVGYAIESGAARKLYRRLVK